MDAYTSTLTPKISGTHPVPSITPDSHPFLMLVRRGSAGYESLSRLIKACRNKTDGLNPDDTYPFLMGLVDARGDLLAGIGIRRAEDQTPLFLERYFDRPVEIQLKTKLGQHIQRRSVAEIGNLTSFGKCDLSFLLKSMFCHLALKGVRHILFLGGALLEYQLHKLGIFPHVLAKAKIAHNGYRTVHWGTYCTTRPKIMVADILQNIKLSQNPNVA